HQPTQTPYPIAPVMVGGVYSIQAYLYPPPQTSGLFSPPPPHLTNKERLRTKNSLKIKIDL
ncbi:hypothetical protein, partial [Helicobacter ailurogastricus]|uniref:hypothetical protein n=1 Tax=Helicobacter ailurogastricus TaxID=1578720 RepID=UPI0024920915